MTRKHRIPLENNNKNEEEIRRNARSAFYVLRAQAMENGLTDMTLDDINKEIRIARDERR